MDDKGRDPLFSGFGHVGTGIAFVAMKLSVFGDLFSDYKRNSGLRDRGKNEKCCPRFDGQVFAKLECGLAVISA